MALARGLVTLLPICTAILTSEHGASLETPITKVVTLLNDMLTKAKATKEEEANRFAAFTQWCRDVATVRSGEIREGKERMEVLKAEILEAEASIRGDTERIQELDVDIERWKTDKRSATAVREKEEADYTATLQDYSESVDALTQAIAVLKKQSHDRAQNVELVQALLQVQRRAKVPLETKNALAVFLQHGQPDAEAMPDEQLSYKPPEANAYEFQSGGVIEMLEGLKEQFEGKKSDLMADEMKAQHAYEMILQQLTDNIENALHEISGKTQLTAEVKQAKAEDEGSLAQAASDLEEDQKYLDDAADLCRAKADDFKSRAKLRVEEIETLQKVVEIVTSESVTGAADKHLPVLVQAGVRAHTALPQVRGGEHGPSPLQARLAAFLAERARVSGSRLLTEVSQRAAEDPFAKVKKLVKDLIVQLMEESTEETEHKGWCDAELSKNKVTRDSKSEEVTQLTADVEDLNAQIAQLAQDLTTLAHEIHELEQAMGKATADRNESKESNDQTVKDSKEAQIALQQALAVLKEYYARSAEATALTQQNPALDAPETFDKPYAGMIPEGGNVVDFLEIIHADFTRLESEASTSESTEQEQFEKFMFESKQSKALKENETQHKEDSKLSKESALHSTQQELKMTQEQLSTAVAYYEKLKPTCVDTGISYEDRVKRRNDEIESLQQALKILQGEDIA